MMIFDQTGQGDINMSPLLGQKPYLWITHKEINRPIVIKNTIDTHLFLLIKVNE
jgi:hypothetical protein